MSENIQKIYDEIAVSAWKVVDAAVAAGDGFKTSAISIHEELLKAQGKDQEVAQARYASRQKELALEYKMLDIKLLAAEITAKAAGIIDPTIANARNDARQAFQQAQSDLAELERLELDKIKKTREAQAQKDKEAQEATEQRKRDAAAKTAGGGASGGASGGSSVGVGGGVFKGSSDANVPSVGKGGAGISGDNGAELRTRQLEAASQLATAKAIESAKSSSAGVVVQGKGTSATLGESVGGRGMSNTYNTTVNVDGKDLLSEEQIRRKVLPALNSISSRSR